MKFLRGAFLLLLIAVLALGTGGAAWAAVPDITGIVNALAAGVNNAGEIKKLSGAGGYEGKAYYFDASPSVLEIPLYITASGDTGGTPDLSADVEMDIGPTRTLTDGFEIRATLKIPVSPAPPSTVTFTFSDGVAAESARATLKLAYVEVKPTLTVSRPGSEASMDFYIGVPATNTVTVSAENLSAPDFDLLADPGSWAEGSHLATSQDITVTAGATTGAMRDSFAVKVGGGIIVTGDNDAQVADSAGKTLGTVTIAVRDRGMETSADQGVGFTVGQTVDSRYNVEVIPDWTDVTDLTVFSHASGYELTSVEWNGLTVLTDLTAHEIVITGQPVSEDSSVFTILARNGGLVVASRDFTISVSESYYELLLNGERDYTLEGDIADIFDKRIKVTVSGDSGRSPLVSLLLNSSEDVVITSNGLTVTAYADRGEISVTGSPNGIGGETVAVDAAFPEGTIEGTQLAIVIDSHEYSLNLTPSLINTARNLPFGPVTVNAAISPDATVSVLSIEGSDVAYKNGITAKVPNPQTVVFSGTPLFSGTLTFPFVAHSAGNVPLAASYVQVVTRSAVGGELYSPDPNDALVYNVKRGTQARYNGVNLFMGVDFHLSFFSEVHLTGLKVSYRDPEGKRFSLKEDKDYRLSTDPKTGKMEVIVYLTPDKTGNYTFFFAYEYGETFTEKVTLAAVKERVYGGNNDDGGGGCSAFAPGAALILSPLGFIGVRRRKGR